MPTASFSSFQRSTPFLQRNWARGVDGSSSTMGNTPSSHKSQYIATHDSAQDDENRPPKRRRLDSAPSPPPTKPKNPSLADQLFLAHEVGTVQRALRIQVLQIIHRDAAKIRVSDPLSETARAPRQISETRARCKLTLSHVSRAGESVLHCQSQLCTLKTFESHAVPYQNVRIWLPRPFHIPEDSVFVNRDDDDRFHLADAYKVTVDLEAAGQGDWPPLDPDSLTGSLPTIQRSLLASRRWVLAGELTHVFGKATRSMVPLQLKTTPTKCQATKWLFDVDARWTTGYEASAIRPLEKDVEPSITVYSDGPPLSPVYTTRTPTKPVTHPDASVTHEARRNVQDGPTPTKTNLVNDNLNGANGAFNGDDEDDVDGEETPNRSLRTRNSINYNLKDLSRKAQGKEARNRKRKSFHEVAEGQVVYDVPAQTVQLGSFRCVACGITHDCLARLQTHLKLLHPEFDFVTNISGKGAHIQVSHRYEYPSHDDGQHQVHSIQSPSKVFDAEQFANGDDSWIKLRTAAAEPSEEVVRKKTRKRGPAASEIKGLVVGRKSAHQKLRVPLTKYTLYDPISRLPLEPGSEFHRPQADSRWLVQWHREAIEDFSDIGPEEREFLTTWDEFMLTRRVSSDVYLPSSWLEFVKSKVDWLVASDSRMVEFGKHLTYLLTRHVLDDSTIQEAFQCLTAAKDRFEQSGSRRSSAPSQQVEKTGSATGCQICGCQALGPRLVLCANPKCLARSYHADCVGMGATREARDRNEVSAEEEATRG